MGAVGNTLVVLCLMAVTATAELQNLEPLEADSRLFFNTTDISISADFFIFGGVLLLSLLLIAGIAFLIISLLGGDEETGYSSYSGGGGGSSGGSSYSGSGRSLLSENIWSTVSIIDWIALAEELYNTEDLTSRQCQQQLVCELKRSAPAWGETARAASGAIDYISYMKILNLPEPVDQLLSQYEEAASAGRDSHMPCGMLFSKCTLNIQSLLKRYTHTNS